jgi:hypothetical protein
MDSPTTDSKEVLSCIPVPVPVGLERTPGSASFFYLRWLTTHGNGTDAFCLLFRKSRGTTSSFSKMAAEKRRSLSYFKKRL